VSKGLTDQGRFIFWSSASRVADEVGFSETSSVSYPHYILSYAEDRCLHWVYDVRKDFDE
jgi:hypothetical protein